MSISGMVGTSWPWNKYPEWKLDDDLIGQAIRNVILTSNGERKMSVKYGSNCISTVFENKGEILKALLRRTLKLAISNNLPYVNLLNVDVDEESGDNDVVIVNIEYQYNGTINTVSVEV